jgi:acyl carrier protein
MNLDEKVKKVMSAVFDVPIEEIDENSSPDSIGNWDSLHHMNLIIALEEEFNVTFNEDDISNMLNYKLIKLSLADHIESK